MTNKKRQTRQVKTIGSFIAEIVTVRDGKNKEILIRMVKKVNPQKEGKIWAELGLEEMK